MLINAFFNPQFHYFLVIQMFHCRASNKKINRFPNAVYVLHTTMTILISMNFQKNAIPSLEIFKHLQLRCVKQPMVYLPEKCMKYFNPKENLTYSICDFIWYLFMQDLQNTYTKTWFPCFFIELKLHPSCMLCFIKVGS